MDAISQNGGDASGGRVHDPAGRLDSWKAVAGYLGRSDKTVRRWEEKEGLPIHRLHHDKRGSVYAYKQELDNWWQSRKAAIEAEEAVPAADAPALVGRRNRLPGLAWISGGMVVAAVLLVGLWLGFRPREAPAVPVRFSRITDFVGLEESPAISPDGKMIAFVARGGKRRQVWIRMLSGGAPVQITHDDAEHDNPRWLPDAASLIYYSPAPAPGSPGTIWEIPALGGASRRIASALGGGDCSHDGKLIALFQSGNGTAELVTVERRGTSVKRVAEVNAEDVNDRPRWSPDDRWIAFQSHSGSSFDERIKLIASAGGTPRVVARSDTLRGLTWSPDGTAVVYSSSSGSTILYPPIFNLRLARLDGSGERQLTFGDVSYLEPDVQNGGIAVSSVRSQSDIWKFPSGGTAESNTRQGIRVTAQTGRVQTPSVSPDGTEMVYLSDSGGHGNLWIARTDGSAARQLTFERDPAVAVGVPVWSPAGTYIVFVQTSQARTALWLIHPDGSGLRQLTPAGVLASWSSDGRWVYYVRLRDGGFVIEKAPVEGGPSVLVRSDSAVAPAAADGSILYYATFLKGEYGSWDFEFRRARPENGGAEAIARIAGASVPNDATNFQMVLSPDGKWLAAPFTDGTTTNLWLLPSGGGPMKRVTDFGGRPVQIVRRVSWSPDGEWLYAAVAEYDADIVLLEGLLRPNGR